jgi:hypothetical protein
MQNWSNENLDDSVLRVRWKWTVAICISYAVVMAVFVSLIAYDLRSCADGRCRTGSGKSAVHFAAG